jgi:hypothetical protein
LSFPPASCQAGSDSTAGSGSWTNALVDGDLTWFAEVNGPALWVEDGSGIHTAGLPGTGATVRVAGPCR